MTMHTRIRVKDPVDAHEFFRYGQSVLAQRDSEKRSVEQHVWTDEESKYRPDGTWHIANQLGQNLPGIWDVYYRQDAALREVDSDHDEYCDDDCSGKYHDKACFLEAGIDTSYSYNDEFGSCGNLHAWFIAQLMNWLDEREATYEWYDESGGAWYTSAKDLVHLCESGAAASSWFSSVVVPAIPAMIKEVKE